MTEQEWETYLQIQTAGHQQLFPTDRNYHRYEATPYADFEHLFTHYHPATDASFIDFGCGKGRFNFYVAALGYQSLGLEMDAQLYDTALTNRHRFLQAFPTAHIDFVCGFAQAYQITASQNCFYFFNPFHTRIFQAVVNNILASYATTPRDMALILYYPSHEYLAFLDNCTPFEHYQTLICSPHDPRHRFVIYHLSVNHS